MLLGTHLMPYMHTRNTPTAYYCVELPFAVYSSWLFFCASLCVLMVPLPSWGTAPSKTGCVEHIDSLQQKVVPDQNETKQLGANPMPTRSRSGIGSLQDYMCLPLHANAQRVVRCTKLRSDPFAAYYFMYLARSTISRPPYTAPLPARQNEKDRSRHLSYLFSRFPLSVSRHAAAGILRM